MFVILGVMTNSISEGRIITTRNRVCHVVTFVMGLTRVTRARDLYDARNYILILLNIF